MEAAPPPAEQQPVRRPLSSTERSQLYRDRLAKKLSVFRVDLREIEKDVLIRKGYLAEAARQDVDAVRNALYGFLDANLR
jgi:hypothetical protein